MASVADTALSLGSRVGRYFSLTSVLPTLLLVLWVYLLIKSGAWNGHPNVSQALGALRSWSLADVAWAVLATFVVASFTHALQFPMTQVLEGYWPTTGLTGWLQVARVLRYRDEFYRLHLQLGRRGSALEDQIQGILNELRVTNPGTYRDLSTLAKEELRDEVLDLRPGDRLMRHVLGEQEIQRRLNRLPKFAGRMLPTRLGNALRRYEDLAGSQYRLDSITVMPHLLLIAPQHHIDYVNDMRQSMDTAIRLCIVSLAATVITIPFLVTDGWWLLVALVPYALAYLAYRGSISAAVHYGIALCTIIDLDRFLLYENLRLPPPRSLAAERRLNTRLLKLLRFEDDLRLRYTSPSAQDPTETVK